MRYIKTFESFCNETMDMFTLPVDPIKSADKVYNPFYAKMKTHVKSFIDKIKNEGKETKEAFNLVVKASKGEIELTKEQRSEIYTQLGDVFKSIGLAALTVVPGDVLIFMLIKFFKAEKYVFPSSFVTNEDFAQIGVPPSGNVTGMGEVVAPGSSSVGSGDSWPSLSDPFSLIPLKKRRKKKRKTSR